MKKKIIRYSVAGTISILLALLIFLVNQGFKKNGTELYKILCDAAFATGTIYVCVGLLFWVTNMGIFDMLAFGMIKLFDLFKKDVKDTKYANYLEYKEARKEVYIHWIYLVLIGVAYIAVASLFLYLYSKQK